MKQTGTCRPICTGNDCITINQDRVDFKAAEEACRERNGEIMTLHYETDESILDTLSQELFGDFWIGLRLPAGACSNLSAPLRGYEWTSGSPHRSFIPSLSTWKDSFKVCSPRCVSLSNDQKWTERLCSDRTDGYLCRTKHKDACQAQELSDPIFFQSSEGCSTGPCQHDCKDVKGGYECSCFQGYIADRNDRKQCKLHCDKPTCPMVCEGTSDIACTCADGYIQNGNVCVAIDECVEMDCVKIPLDDSKSIKAESSESFNITTPVTEGSVNPTANNSTQKTHSVAAGGFLWILIFVPVAVVVVIIVVRLYVVKRQKRREQNSNQSIAAAPMDNI